MKKPFEMYQSSKSYFCVGSWSAFQNSGAVEVRKIAAGEKSQRFDAGNSREWSFRIYKPTARKI